MSYGTSTLSSAPKNELKKMEITINVQDLDMSQLTTAVMDLGTNINGYLMQVFKDAHEKGLKSGYVLGYDEGIREGKEEGLKQGKMEGIKIGKIEGKHDYLKLLREAECDDMNYEQPISLSSYNSDNEGNHRNIFRHNMQQNINRLTHSGHNQ